MNRLIFLLLTLIISSSVLMADLSREELNILVPSGSRFVTELSGNWERSKDMQEWTGIRIPISEQVEEKVIYKRFVKIPANMVDNYSWQLYILGTDHTVEIYWNEQFIGRYVGAMMPFNVRIPNNTVRNETNEIRLVVMPASGKVKQVRSQHLNAPREFTGIIREILLVGTPHAWISEVRNTIKLKSQNSAEIVSKINITSSEIKYLINKLRVKDSISLDGNEKISLSLNAELRALNSDLVIASGSTKTINVERDRTISENILLHASGINLWSTENPELYKLTVSIKRNDLLIDDYSTNIGFKSIRAAESSDGAQLLLNGKQFMIKGISYIEDYQDLGRTLSSTKLFQDIDLIKKLGANTVRVKFYPPHPLFVNYCNAKGLHLMAELPNYDVPSDIINLDEIKVYNQNLAKQYLIHYDSEPSMFAWGLGEGVDENSQKYKYFSESIIKIFNSESDKLLYKILPHGIRQVNTDGYDFFGYSDIRQNVDFNQINNEFVRLGGLLNGKPLFMAFGSEIQIDNHNGYSDPLSVEFQAYNILNSFKIVEKNKGAGCIVNTFNDYLQNKPSLTTDNKLQYIHTSGLVDRNRRERLSFSTLQSLYNNEKEPLLNAGSFTRNTPVIYLIIGILLAILLIFLINRFKRFREYMFRSILRPYNFYADIRDQRIISSVQTVLLGIILSATVGIYLSSFLYFYKDSEVLEYFMMIALPSNYLKEFVYLLVWMPELSFLIITLISYALAFMTAWIIRVFAIFSQARIYWNDCLTISIWAALPAVLLLPVAIVLIRLLVIMPGAAWLFLLLYIITSIWTVARLLKSISVVFDIRVMKSYLIGLAIIVISLGSPIVYYHIQYSLFSYFSFFFNVLLS